MVLAKENLPDNVDELRDMVVKLSAQKADSERMVELLSEMLRLMRIKKYGAKSEKLTDAQLELLELEPGVLREEVEAEIRRKTPAAPRKRATPHPGRVELPAHLPRVEEIVPCAPEDCRCGSCGGATRVIGHETAEVLEMKPAEFFVRVIKREKRACPLHPEGGVQTAPPPARILPKSKFSDAFIVSLVTNKYLLHLPLYRQAARLVEEQGLDLPAATLCGVVMKTGGLFEALSRACRAELLQGRYIQADETLVRVQGRGTKPDHKAGLFEYGRPGGPVVFDFQMGHGHEGPAGFLRGFRGVLQCDGGSCFNGLEEQGVTRAGCMAHARRKFHEAYKAGAKCPKALGVLMVMRKLYGEEAWARERKMDAAQRLAHRRQKSRPLMDTLKERILEARQKALPQSLLAKACGYALNQWEPLGVFLDHGDVDIDNNACERSIRPVALGRKNWIHIGSEMAGPKVAAIYSVLETCRRIGVPVREYLEDVLPGLSERLASDLARLTPMAWKQSANT